MILEAAETEKMAIGGRMKRTKGRDQSRMITKNYASDAPLFEADLLQLLIEVSIPLTL